MNIASIGIECAGRDCISAHERIPRLSILSDQSWQNHRSQNPAEAFWRSQWLTAFHGS